VFQSGQSVLCVIVDDETADGRHVSGYAVLKRGAIYQVEDFKSSEECKCLFPESKWWQTNRGRMMLKEHPGLEFFGKRFKPTGSGIKV